MKGGPNAIDIIRRTEVKVSPSTFALVSVSEQNWKRLLDSPELSPRMTAPFMILRDDSGVTLMLDKADLENARPAIGGSKIEEGFRLLTFEAELDFSVVGFLAAVSGMLADAGIPIMAISAFSRDHILVKQDDLAKTLGILGKHFRGLC